MCLLDRHQSAKLRRRPAIANLALAIGLILWSFAHPVSVVGRDAIHFVVGLLLGLSITINLMLVYGRGNGQS
jgi:hypothetical protein